MSQLICVIKQQLCCGGKQLSQFTSQTHLDHICLVSLQHLDGLGGLRINYENTGVTSLSYEPLPAPTDHVSKAE